MRTRGTMRTIRKVDLGDNEDNGNNNDNDANNDNDEIETTP